MSESEQMGRCRMEITAAYERTRWTVPNDSDLLIADAIDRLAADVAAVKEAVCDGSVAEERDRFLAGMGSAIKERDAAIRERDQWREEARLAVVNRDEARAEVERLKAARDAPQPAAPAAGWLTQEERKVIIGADSELSAIGHHRPPDKELCLRLSADLRRLVKRHDAGSQPAAPPPGWLTERERRAVAYFADVCRDDLVPDEWTVNAGVLRSMLARAGSPPVVEVPAMVFSSGSYEMQKRYRAAMDRAGVAWKEVGRE